MGRSGRMGEEFRSMERIHSSSRSDSRESPSWGNPRGNNVLDFARCVRADGTAYGTGGKCRLGTEQEKPDEEKIARVKHALSCSFDEFLKTYSKTREKKFADAAEEEAKRLAAMTPNDVTDIVAFQSLANLNQLVALSETISSIGESKGVAAAAKLIASKDVFNALKWGLQNPQRAVTLGSLKLIWSGKNPNESVKTALKDGTKFGRRRVVVHEHIVPTKLMPDMLLKGLGTGKSKEEIAEFFLKGNLISITSAPEDQKLQRKGFALKLPDAKNSFSRYDETKTKLFPAKVHEAADMSKLAKEAKKAGWTFEEWAASVIDI